MSQAVLITTFTNDEDQMKSYVWDNGRGSYNVTLQDIESEEFCSGVRGSIPTLDEALTYAKRLTGHK